MISISYSKNRYEYQVGHRMATTYKYYLDYQRPPPINKREKIRQNLSNLSRRDRYENTLRAFLSEDGISLTMELGDERPSEVKHRMDDLISKKGWQNTITVLAHLDSVILINQRKGRYLRHISDAARRPRRAVPVPTGSRRGAYLPSPNSR